MYNFIGEDSIPLSRYLDISEYVPTIAYKVPDLEAFVQLTLAEIGTGTVKACVQATLSNGWTTHEPGVEWATGAIAFLAFVSAVWQSRESDSIAPYRLLDIIYLFQAIAASGLLNLNYPIVYRSFTFNFRWALGFFPAPGFQTAINDMRNRTGGHLDDATGNALALTNRKSSPYNALANMPTVHITSFAGDAIFSRSEDGSDLARFNDTLVLAAADVQTQCGSRVNPSAATKPVAYYLPLRRHSTRHLRWSGLPVHRGWFACGCYSAVIHSVINVNHLG